MAVTATDTINKELYLFKSDLLEWEIQATGPYTLDDKIPSKFIKN
jgi:hypothetical protein